VDFSCLWCALALCIAILVFILLALAGPSFRARIKQLAVSREMAAGKVAISSILIPANLKFKP
jgi:hypothetical protein